MTDLDASTLRDSYDRQLRPEIPDPVPAGVTVERDGPLVRILGLDHGGFLTYRTLDGLAGPELDALIARQVDLFRQRGEPVEWKHNSHDEPADLPDRLRAAGFVPQERETVVIGPVAPLAAAVPVLPEGVRLREVTGLDDLERIAAMEQEVWGEDRSHLVTGLLREIEADPRSITVVGGRGGGDGGQRRLGALSQRHRLRQPVGRFDAGAVATPGRLPGAGGLPGPAGRPARQGVVAGGRVGGQPAHPGATRLRPGHHDHPVRLHSVIMEQRLTDDEQQVLKTGAFGAVFLVSNADPGVFAMIRESFAASGAFAGPAGW
ncbi:hypothetical protein TPA0907_63630 [Micromonospora humidisoli]|nr:hypothetical protein TPA0907_63630 [Micromonospora sp. AKA109]